MIDPHSPVPFVLGVLPFGSRVGPEESYAILDCFREAGGRYLDTADNYVQWEPGATGDESEDLLGAWFRDRPGAREEMVLATKVGARSDPSKPGGFPADMEGLSRAAIRRAIDGSLRRLGTDRVDLLYAHVMDRATPVEETVDALADLVDEGRVGSLGCSNHDLDALRAAHRVADERGRPGYVAVQQRFTYLRPSAMSDFGVQRLADDAMLDYLGQRPGCTALGFSPLLSGAYVVRDRVPPAYRTPENERRLAVLDEIAAGHGASPVHVVLAWMLARDQRVVPVIGVSSVEQLDDCLAGLRLDLARDELVRLDTAGD